MSDAPKIAERVARATRSSHLQQKVTPTDIDVVGALGLAGLTNSVASIVFRLKYSHQRQCYPDALRIVIAESQGLGKKYGWTTAGQGPIYREMTKAVLNYWLNDRCIACSGLGHQKELGAPFLQAMACEPCGGTGRAPKPPMPTKEWEERFNLLLARIEDLERRAGGAVMAKLAGEMDLR